MGGPNYALTYQDTLSVAVTENVFNIDYVDSGTLFWTFERFSAGSQFVNGQSAKIELFYDAAGDDNWQLIDAIYTVSETYQHEFDVDVEYPFNVGLSKVKVKRTLFGGTTAREVYAQWQGSVV